MDGDDRRKMNGEEKGKTDGDDRGNRQTNLLGPSVVLPIVLGIEDLFIKNNHSRS